MKTLLAGALSLTLVVGAVAQDDSLTLDTYEQQATARTNDYVTGADVQRDQALYRANYLNDSFWRSLWERGGANSETWYTQLRVLKLHLQEAIQHLQDSTNWMRVTTDIRGTNGVVLELRKQNRPVNYTGILDARTITHGNFEWLLDKILDLWVDKPTTDPTSRYIERDAEILFLGTPDMSYSLSQTAGRGSSPDITLFNLMITDAGAMAYTETLSTNIGSNDINEIVNAPTNTLANPTYTTSLANMQEANQILTPGHGNQPSEIVATIYAMFANPRDPNYIMRLHDKYLSAAFGDMAQGSWKGFSYVYLRPIRHTSSYYTYATNYEAKATKLIGYYKALLDCLNVQLEEANKRDAAFLSQVADYREQSNRQLPFTPLLSSAEAKQIFLRETGNTKLSNIPLISIAAYLVYEYGPPWANTRCFSCGTPYIPNPLYYTIWAQLVRGLERTQGQVYTGTQQAQNMLKNQMQELIGTVYVQDLYTKDAELQQRQEEYEKSYGNESIKVKTAKATYQSTIPTMSQGDAVTQVTMQNAQNLRSNSVLIVNQNDAYYNDLTGSGTLIEREGLRNVQQAHRTQAIQDLNNAVNNRAAFRAAARNVEAQKRLEQQHIDNATRNIPRD